MTFRCNHKAPCKTAASFFAFYISITSTVPRCIPSIAAITAETYHEHINTSMRITSQLPPHSQRAQQALQVGTGRRRCYMLLLHFLAQHLLIRCYVHGRRIFRILGDGVRNLWLSFWWRVCIFRRGRQDRLLWLYFWWCVSIFRDYCGSLCDEFCEVLKDFQYIYKGRYVFTAGN